jgi:hypothetical protein
MSLWHLMAMLAVWHLLLAATLSVPSSHKPLDFELTGTQALREVACYRRMHEIKKGFSSSTEVATDLSEKKAL